jgi:hypothetical protein
MRYVGIRSAQSVAICVKGYTFLLLREKEIDTEYNTRFVFYLCELCFFLHPLCF